MECPTCHHPTRPEGHKVFYCYGCNHYFLEGEDGNAVVFDFVEDKAKPSVRCNLATTCGEALRCFHVTPHTPVDDELQPDHLCATPGTCYWCSDQPQSCCC